VASRRNEGLFANRHMHMLEACPALEGEVRDDATGVQLSNEIVTLTKESLLGPPNGARHEFCADYGRTGNDPQLSIPGQGLRDPGGRSRLMFHCRRSWGEQWFERVDTVMRRIKAPARISTLHHPVRAVDFYDRLTIG